MADDIRDAIKASQSLKQAKINVKIMIDRDFKITERDRIMQTIDAEKKNAFSTVDSKDEDVVKTSNSKSGVSTETKTKGQNGSKDESAPSIDKKGERQKESDKKGPDADRGANKPKQKSEVVDCETVEQKDSKGKKTAGQDSPKPSKTSSNKKSSEKITSPGEDDAKKSKGKSNFHVKAVEKDNSRKQKAAQQEATTSNKQSEDKKKADRKTPDSKKKTKAAKSSPSPHNERDLEPSQGKKQSTEEDKSNVSNVDRADSNSKSKSVESAEKKPRSTKSKTKFLGDEVKSENIQKNKGNKTIPVVPPVELSVAERRNSTGSNITIPKAIRTKEDKPNKRVKKPRKLLELRELPRSTSDLDIRTSLMPLKKEERKISSDYDIKDSFEHRTWPQTPPVSVENDIKDSLAPKATETDEVKKSRKKSKKWQLPQTRFVEFDDEIKDSLTRRISSITIPMAIRTEEDRNKKKVNSSYEHSDEHAGPKLSESRTKEEVKNLNESTCFEASTTSITEDENSEMAAVPDENSVQSKRDLQSKQDLQSKRDFLISPLRPVTSEEHAPDSMRKQNSYLPLEYIIDKTGNSDFGSLDDEETESQPTGRKSAKCTIS